MSAVSRSLLDAVAELFPDGIPAEKTAVGKTKQIYIPGVGWVTRHGRSREPGIPKWPIESDSLGVAAKDAQKLRDSLAKHGIPTEVTPAGNPILVSPDHARKVAAHAQKSYQGDW